jgi:simple sugar transport system ATP-binding protein
MSAPAPPRPRAPALSGPHPEAPLLALAGIRKSFPGVAANDGVDLDLLAGEIHAVLGENGAGKTTLMNVLAGLYQPDAGSILLEGSPVQIRSPRDAYRHGIGMVHQNFRLVPSFTVAENVLLGLEPGATVGGQGPGAGGRLRMSDHLPRIEELSRRFGLPVDVEAPVWQLSVGQQQRVEIVKMLYRGARILILDEPTAALTPLETDGLFATLRTMREAGRAIFFISHKLDEVLRSSDRISVMRRGRVVGTLRPAETDARRLANLMVGEAVEETRPAAHAAPGAPVLECRDLRVLNDRGLEAVRGVSLAVRAGEVVGIAGVAGNGQQELAEALAGLRAVKDGAILLGGADVTRAAPRARIVGGLRYLPADRHGVAAAPNLSIADNLILKTFRDPAFGPPWWQDRAAILDHARRRMAEFNVLGGAPDAPIRLLSGGNLQKVLLARELTAGGTALVAQSPTRGLDVGATRFVHEALRRQARRGQGVLLISEDLDEILLLADRVGVMFAGQITGMLPAAEATREAVGLLMAGTRVP